MEEKTNPSETSASAPNASQAFAKEFSSLVNHNEVQQLLILQAEMCVAASLTLTVLDIRSFIYHQQL